MKQNFSDKEISVLVVTFGSKLQISINRAGNIKVVDNNEPKRRNPLYFTHNPFIRGFWTFYKNANGYLWRRMDGTGYAYPLNMKRGPINQWGDASYTIEDSYFKTFDDAVNYFKNYLEKYRGIKF